MTEVQRTVHNQPELSRTDGSVTAPIRFFNTFAIEHPTVVSAILQSSALIVEFPNHREAAEVNEGDIVVRGTKIIRDLLAEVGNGKHIDYDNETWGNVMSDEQYRYEARSFRSIGEHNTSLEEKRRVVAVIGLGIYAARLSQYTRQTIPQAESSIPVVDLEEDLDDMPEPLIHEVTTPDVA